METLALTEPTYIPLAIAMGIGLAASCGFRVFLPPLLLAIGLQLGLVPVSWVKAEFAQAMMSGPVTLALALATLIELGAAHIPGIDHALDVVSGPLAIGAGTLLGANFLFVPIEDPMIRYGLGLITGGGVAGVFHAGNAGLRALSTASSGGLLNPFFGFFESGISALLSTIAMLLPLLAIGVVVVALLGMGYLAMKGYKIFTSKKTTPS